MLTWKEIKESVERNHPIHKVKDNDLLTYLIVHMDTVAFGVVGQDGFVAQTNHHGLGQACKSNEIEAQQLSPPTAGVTVPGLNPTG